MTMKAAVHATGTFEIKSWDEKAYNEGEGTPKLTKASVIQSLTGDIQGEGSVEYLMLYRSKDSASYIGHQRVSGELGGRAGTFVLQCIGTFENGTAKGSWSVVPGSGTGDLRDLRGDGGFSAEKGCTAGYTFDYDFE
jgi:hypothetical protein